MPAFNLLQKQQETRGYLFRIEQTMRMADRPQSDINTCLLNKEAIHNVISLRKYCCQNSMDNTL